MEGDAKTAKHQDYITLLQDFLAFTIVLLLFLICWTFFLSDDDELMT